METRAPFVSRRRLRAGGHRWPSSASCIGSTTPAALARASVYHVQFDGSVPGLLVGAGVLFNGIRVGEVTDLALAPESPRRVDATISVASNTPVRADTKVGLDFQGLTGVPVVALEGGMQLGNTGDGADADRRARRGAKHDAGRPRCVAQGRFGAERELRAAEGHHRQSARSSRKGSRETPASSTASLPVSRR